MKISDLQRMKSLLNLSELARQAGINDRTLSAKVRHGRELTVTESEALQEALSQAGLFVDRPPRPGRGE